MISTWLIIATVTMVAAALFAAADGALLATGHTSPRQVIAHPDRAHRALALGRVLSHLLIGCALAIALHGTSWHVSTKAIVAVALLLVSVTIIEGFARSAGYARGMTMVQRLAPVVVVADLLLYPLTWSGGVVERALGRMLPPADPDDQVRIAGHEQFREVVAAEADVTAAEEELLHGVFSLGDTQVEEIMVPRIDVVGIDRTTPWSEVVDRVRSSEHARFPVFDETLDNVAGILYAKDLLPTVVAGTEPDDWSTLVRPATFIPATKTIDQQLRDFKSQRTHIALVMDEYGGMAGLVTIEDVLEEIVGDIRDEYDVERPEIEQEGNDRFWVSGRLSLADLSELLSYDFERDDLTTVAGLVYDSFGRVPRAGEKGTLGPFRIVVERVRRRTIERVYIERVSPAVED
jgi:putative hemolysin